MFTLEKTAQASLPVIRVKTRTAECTPVQAHPGEWYDLAVSEDYGISANEFKYLDLGVCIEVPEGYEAIVTPRSSTFKRYRILQTNSIGVIDHAFCGDNDWWQFPAYAVEDTFIAKGSRIAQFRIQPVQMNCSLMFVDEMGNPDRNGLGSTGV